ncbi:MAG: DNA polymerase III subunit gamma/tau [Eubacteriales bacterium]|nr:DNA polymerase III subunit gamma/tau [Eubacteriales bacterium]
MAYRALYRQYRPVRFSEVIGQDHITTTLKNQVASDRPAHAYLFCGTRGTGKTTSARILARAVNCLSPENGEPCGKCEACRMTAAEGASDITEIDAASNNSVSDVRDLIESAQYAPLRLNRRVFIIDEVHMLSGAAFNALLKTLEEPPEHIIFILATTEPQKLPSTIISRCQRFDFHRISLSDIKRTLQSVLSRAGATIEDDGLTLIARAAQGGMRDALSLADQCLAFCGDTVTTQNVYDVLGSMEDAFLFEMSEALLASDSQKALRLLDGIVQSGRDLSVLAADLSTHFRALLLAKTCGRCEDLLDCTEDTMTRYLEQAKSASEAQLMLAVDRLLSAQNDMRYLPSPRTMLESALIHICRPEDTLSLANLESRVDRLEAQVKNGVPIPAAVVPVSEPRSEIKPVKKQDPKLQTKPEPGPESAPWPEEAPPDLESGYRAAPSAESEEPATPAPEPETPQRSLNDAATLWRETIAGIPNMFIQALAREAVAQRFENNTLVVCFSQAQEAKRKSLSAPINFEPTQRALQTLIPDAKLVITAGKVVPASEQAESIARELFGDKLTIE